MTLNHQWQISDDSNLSTALYLSLGRGNGYSGQGRGTYNGQSISYSSWYGSSNGTINMLFRNADGTRDYAAIQEMNEQSLTGSNMAMGKSVNDHLWYGVMSNYTKEINDELTFSVNGERGSLAFSLMDPNYLSFYDATSVGSPMGGVRGYTRIECVGRYPSPASGFPAIKAPQGWLRGHIGCMVNYLSSVANQTPCTPSFEDGAYVQTVLEAALQSAREGQEVHLC
jgi:predicted dehydrogenase